MSILVINAGSSSLKFGLFDAAAMEPLASGSIDWTAPSGQAELVVRARGSEESRSRVDVSDHRVAVAQALRFWPRRKTGPRGMVQPSQSSGTGSSTAARSSAKASESTKT